MGNIDYKEMMENRNAANVFANSIGLRLTALEPGHAVSEMDIGKEHLNPIGSVHGGCLYTAADIASGGAAISYGISMTTVDCSFRYLRPGIGTTHIRAEAKVIKRGRRLSVIQTEVTDQDGTVLCIGTYSFMPV